jgi:dTMP kinase
MTHRYSGKLILFEGPEGAGKSTLIKALEAALSKVGFGVVVTKEPYGEYRKRLLEVHPEIKPSPEQELDLFIRNRAEHFEELVIPSLKEGKIILCDRSSPSTIAYQHYGRGLNLTDILVRDAQARKNINFDQIFLLDLNPEIGLKRKEAETRFELEKIDFHYRVRNGYLDQARDDRFGVWEVIDASKPAEEVYIKVLNKILGKICFAKKTPKRKKK